MSAKNPKLLPPNIMARRLGLRPADLRAAIAAGDVPAIRVGGGMLVSPAAVERALLRRAVIACSAADEEGARHD